MLRFNLLMFNITMQQIENIQRELKAFYTHLGEGVRESVVRKVNDFVQLRFSLNFTVPMVSH